MCISNSRYFYHVLDNRVKSRLDATLVEFATYPTDQIISILKDRAQRGLREGTYNDQIIQKIADYSKGDARVAVHTLKNAASIAESKFSEAIQLEHIKSGLSIARNVRGKYVLAKLSEHHQLLFGIIQDYGQIQSGELWEEYQRRCAQAQMQTAASRTFSLYVKKLEELDLIMGIRALGVKGNVRIFTTKHSI